MLQIQVQFVADTGAVWLLFTLCFCHRCASITQSDSVRHPIRFRPPPDQIPSATRSDSVRHPIRFRSPPVGGYGILPYPRSPPRSPLRDPTCCPHRGCSGLRCTNQATTNQPATNPTKQSTTNQTPNQTTNQPTNHLILPIKSSHISNKNTNFANP